MPQRIDTSWFKDRMEDNGLSLRQLAKNIDLDPSSLHRTLNGTRKMQLEEAKHIANFLRAPVGEVMRHAGVAVDLDGLPTRIMLTSIIREGGEVERIKDPKPLPQAIIEKAQAAISRVGNGQIIAAQIHASKGPLAIWDDAVVLFRPTESVDPAAVGTLSIIRDRDSMKQGMAKLLRARKTGEATIQSANGDVKEMALDTATPVIAIIP